MSIIFDIEKQTLSHIDLCFPYDAFQASLKANPSALYTVLFVWLLRARGTIIAVSLVTKQLLGNVFKTFQNGWILVEMFSFLLVVFRFILMEFQLVFIHENQQLKTNINEMFENGCK